MIEPAYSGVENLDRLLLTFLQEKVFILRIFLSLQNGWSSRRCNVFLTMWFYVKEFSLRIIAEPSLLQQKCALNTPLLSTKYTFSCGSSDRNSSVRSLNSFIRDDWLNFVLRSCCSHHSSISQFATSLSNTDWLMVPEFTLELNSSCGLESSLVSCVALEASGLRLPAIVTFLLVL